MLPVLFALGIAAGWYVVATRACRETVSMRLLLAGTCASGQIVTTCLALSVAGLLGIQQLCALNVGISALAVAAAMRFGIGPHRPRLADDLRSLVASARNGLGWETVSLTILALFAAAWVATAAYFYPPRGTDDGVYHLPPIYQAVKDHRLQILPVSARPFFAFPLNGEMVFLWTVVLAGSTRWIDAAQAPFALLGMLAVYALGRRFGLAARGSVFAAGLFALMPVVVGQASVNYVDLIANAWVLAAAGALLSYETTGSRFALASGGLASGLLAGSKYQALLFALTLAGIAGILLARREADGRRRILSAAAFGLPAVGAGSYWYVRNAIDFSNPFFPLPVSLLGRTVLPGVWPQGPSTWSHLPGAPAEIFRIAVWDPGLGTYNGGFGFLVWGFALPGLAYLAARVARRDGARGLGRILVLALVLVGLVTLLLPPYEHLWLTPRYVLSIGGLVFLAFAFLIQDSAERRLRAAPALRGAGVLGAFLSLLAAAPSNSPLLNLFPVAEEAPQMRAVSEMHYIMYVPGHLQPLASVWAPLDEMTRGGSGLSVYQAASSGTFWTAQTYGTELQNQVWEFERTLTHDPEAFLYHSPAGDTLYVGKEITRESLLGDPRYRLVASGGEDTTLYVSRDALASGGREARLTDYYRRRVRGLIERTAASARTMQAGSVVVVPFPLAAAYLVHRADGVLAAEVEAITAKDAEIVAARWPDRVVYTAGSALAGRKSRPFLDLEVGDVRIPIVRNEPRKRIGDAVPVAKPATNDGGL